VNDNAAYDEAVTLAKIMVKQTGFASEEPAMAALCSALVLADAECARMRPVFEAACRIVDKARTCVDRPWMGCSMDHDTIESYLGDEIDGARGKQ
jgi:hypothetical protein